MFVWLMIVVAERSKQYGASVPVRASLAHNSIAKKQKIELLCEEEAKHKGGLTS
jgi:hypothetical protein